MTGGFGSAVLEALAEAGLADASLRGIPVRLIGLPGDRFVDHGSVGDLRRTCASTPTGSPSRSARRSSNWASTPRRPRPNVRGPHRLTTARPRRIRLDDLLVERGLATDAHSAQALLLAGQVRVGEGDGARLTASPATWSTGHSRARAGGAAAVRVARRREARRRARRVRHRRRRAGCASTSAPRPAASPTAAAARRGARLCSRRGPRTARRVLARRSPRRVHGAHARRAARSRRRRSRGPAGAGQPGRRRRLVHLAHARAARRRGRAWPRRRCRCRWSSPSSSCDPRDAPKGVVRDPAAARGRR